MNNDQPQEMSFLLTWLRNVSIAGLIGFLAMACTPASNPPIASISQQSSSTQPAAVTSISPQSSSTQPAAEVPANAPKAVAQNAGSNAAVCKVTMAKIVDPNPPTNVRSTPEVKPNNVVGKIDKGQIVTVNSEQNGWLKISQPNGWISKNLAETSCSQKTERVYFPANSNSTTISGRFIGGGSHTYLLKANPGQTLSVTVKQGSLPFIFPPNDPNHRNDLTGGGNYSDKKSWTGQLPAAGEYEIVMESNYKGYDYNLSIQLN